MATSPVGVCEACERLQLHSHTGSSTGSSNHPHLKVGADGRGHPIILEQKAIGASQQPCSHSTSSQPPWWCKQARTPHHPAKSALLRLITLWSEATHGTGDGGGDSGCHGWRHKLGCLCVCGGPHDTHPSRHRHQKNKMLCTMMECQTETLMVHTTQRIITSEAHERSAPVEVHKPKSCCKASPMGFDPGGACVYSAQKSIAKKPAHKNVHTRSSWCQYSPPYCDTLCVPRFSSGSLDCRSTQKPVMGCSEHRPDSNAAAAAMVPVP